MKIAAVIVTYNRLELLKECIEAVVTQDYKVECIYIVNNASTDGTSSYLESVEKKHSFVKIINLESNTGGAGGFEKGIRCAVEDRNNTYDAVWIMDDDTIPETDTLKNLVADYENLLNKGQKISFLASTVFGPKEEPMNLPIIDERPSENGYSDWYRYMNLGLVKIKAATFVSLLINACAIDAIGYPIKEFFIWGDDTEYTMRLTKHFGPAYMSGNSRVLHKRFNAKALSIEEEDNKNRIKMYFYYVRNTLIYESVYYSKRKVLYQIASYFKRSYAILVSRNNFKINKFVIIHKGIVSYLKEGKTFRNRILTQIKKSI